MREVKNITIATGTVITTDIIIIGILKTLILYPVNSKKFAINN